jgi:hypothetical protein
LVISKEGRIFILGGNDAKTVSYLGKKSDEIIELDYKKNPSKI